MEVVSGSSQNEAFATAKAIDESRVEARSKQNYFRLFGESYKGHYRSALLGIAVGVLVGAVIGAAICALPAVGWALAPFIIPSIAGVGALMGAESFSIVGSAAASRSVSLAEKHIRMGDPANAGNPLAGFDDKLMDNGTGYHYEFPHKRDHGRWYNWKSGAVGSALLGTLGAAVGIGGHLTEFAPVEVLSHLPMFAAAAHIVPVAFVTAAPAAAALAFSLAVIGLSFGIERSIIKSIFNQTDSNIQGKINLGRHGPDLGVEQARGKETPGQVEEHRIRRQKEINDLGTAYNKKIFWGAVGGRFRGFAGGVTAGALVGAAAGLVAFGIVCAPIALGMFTMAETGMTALALLGTLTGTFAAAGSLLGMGIFTEAGTEAGAESTARAIDEEFERNSLLKSKGIAIPTPQKPKPQWFNGKALIVSAAIGVALGAALAPVLGTGIVSMFGLHASAMVVSMIAGGITGTTYGLGFDVWKSVARATNWVYEKSYVGPVPEPQKTMEPAIAQSMPGFEKITAQENALLNERMGKRVVNKSITTAAAAKPRSAESAEPVIFMTTSSTLISPIGSYAGQAPAKHLRKLAEQKFASMQVSRGTTIN